MGVRRVRADSIGGENRGYWEAEGATKTFTLPVDAEALSRWVPQDSHLLDYGCGYGRVMAILRSHGYHQLTGVDPSHALMERGRREMPDLPASSFQHFDPPTLPFPDASFDAALLLAVLTVISDDDAQRQVLTELRRVVRPGGVLYISDFWLQEDDRNQERYARGEAKYGQYGVFELAEGAVLRHHSREWIQDLTAEWEVLETRDIPVTTMHGNPALAFFRILRRSL